MQMNSFQNLNSFPRDGTQRLQRHQDARVHALLIEVKGFVIVAVGVWLNHQPAFTLQADELAALSNTVPTGSAAVAFTPVAGAGELLRTATVKFSASPVYTGFGVPTTVTARSTGAVTSASTVGDRLFVVIGSCWFAVAFARACSVEPSTAAGGVTTTVTLALAAFASDPSGQLTVLAATVHAPPCVGVAEPKLTPVGNGKVATTPVAAEGPVPPMGS